MQYERCLKILRPTIDELRPRERRSRRKGQKSSTLLLSGTNSNCRRSDACSTHGASAEDRSEGAIFHYVEEELVWPVQRGTILVRWRCWVAP